LREQIGRLGSQALDDSALDRLARSYGAAALPLLETIRQGGREAEPLPGTRGITHAEVDYVLRNEMPETLTDLIGRRLRLGDWTEPEPEAVESIAARMAAFKAWSPETIERNRAGFRAYISETGI
jgi:glycerol-3-phosphate dehydrogenase